MSFGKPKNFQPFEVSPEESSRFRELTKEERRELGLEKAEELRQPDFIKNEKKSSSKDFIIRSTIMRDFFIQLSRLVSDVGFLKFQNDLIHDFYNVLSQGYTINNNEVALVKRLVDTANAKSYGPVKLYANMLHGSRSYVEFNYQDKPVTKELGDMAIITIVTRNKQRLLQRICIIQNKKSSKDRWDIDIEQLFLLKNFPPFTGNRGIFRNCPDIAFRNYTGCLGAFGLLNSPGEMIFASAPLISELLRGKRSLLNSEISVISGLNGFGESNNNHTFSFLPLFLRFRSKDWGFFMEEFFERHGPLMGFPWGMNHGFLGNSRFSRDLYDLIRAWTQLSIGEISFIYDSVVNKDVDAFSNFLLRSAGFGEMLDIPGDNIFVERKFEGQMAIFALHLDIAHEY